MSQWNRERDELEADISKDTIDQKRTELNELLNRKSEICRTTESVRSSNRKRKLSYKLSSDNIVAWR